MEDKFCVDCRFHEAAKCLHASSEFRPESYLVDRQMAHDWCSSMRGEVGRCGPRGKLWEAK